MQPSELCGSAPVEKFVSREVPSANPASIAYRCEIDLSPGSISDPRKLRAGRTIWVVEVEAEEPDEWAVSTEDIPISYRFTPFLIPNP
jgi:hypothetical protein